jgi:hypothetical protein
MIDGLRFRTARELFAAYPGISQDITATPNGQMSLDFCRGLVMGRVPEEAVTFCAYLLSGRAAIWWGHECLGYLQDVLDEGDRQVLQLVHAWISAPMEQRHRQALYEATATVERTPAIWIAIASGWEIEQSASEYDQTSAAARAVNAGILAGLARVALADRATVLNVFVGMGIQLAEIEALRPVNSIY